jgi:DNA repair exonuclease SbcCD nuclease subunit
MEQTIQILHCGDIHLDSPFSRLSVEKSEQRRAELRETFLGVMRYVRENAIPLVLISGDLFDSDFATGSTIETLRREIAACAPTQFVISPGNHDPYTMRSVYATGRLPENVHIFKEEGLARFDLADLPISVYGWAFLRKTHTFSPLAGKRVEDAERLNLICGHAFLDNVLSDCCPVTGEDIAGFGAHYAALGHIHKYAEGTMLGTTLCAYCGCLEGRSFDEPGIGGVNLIEATRDGDAWHLKSERILFGKRRYETLQIDITGCTEEEDVSVKIAAVIKSHGYGEETMLRIRLLGELPTDFVLPQLSAEEFGIYSLDVQDMTTPTYNCAYLERDMTVKGELYRTLLPRLSGGTPEERAAAADALRVGLAALENRDITII